MATRSSSRLRPPKPLEPAAPTGNRHPRLRFSSSSGHRRCPDRAMRQGIVPGLSRAPAAAPSPIPSNAGATIGLRRRRPDFYSPISAARRVAAGAHRRRVHAHRQSARHRSRPEHSAPRSTRMRFDRLQLTAWALLRRSPASPDRDRLPAAGTLGGSQAGARLNYNVTRQIAAPLRTSSDVGRRGGEVAAGVRVQPLVSIPVWLTAERRQRSAATAAGATPSRFSPRAAYTIGRFRGGSRSMPISRRAWSGCSSRDRFIDGGSRDPARV